MKKIKNKFKVGDLVRLVNPSKYYDNLFKVSLSTKPVAMIYWLNTENYDIRNLVEPDIVFGGLTAGSIEPYQIRKGDVVVFTDEHEAGTLGIINSISTTNPNLVGVSMVQKPNNNTRNPYG